MKTRPQEQLTQPVEVSYLRTLVTGATGFVGRHLVSNLRHNGHEVTVIVRDLEKAKAIYVGDQVTVINVDLSKADFKRVELKCIDVLIHCAWESVSDVNSLSHLESNFENSYRFLKTMIEQGLKKIVVTGSCYEYGQQFGPISANTPTNPNSPYALAKDMLHKSLRLLQDQYSFDLIWARLFYMYGEGQNPQSVIPLFDKALNSNDKIFNMSYGEQLLDYLPVEEVADQLRRLIHCGNGVYNVCSGKPISLRRFLEQRMTEKNKYIQLNLGFYEYRSNESLAIWGLDPLFN
jgi:nucleoside-diphosphate-sugar epimerase